MLDAGVNGISEVIDSSEKELDTKQTATQYDYNRHTCGPGCFQSAHVPHQPIRGDIPKEAMNEL